MKRLFSVCLCLSACGDALGEPRDADPSAALLPRDVGIFISESSIEAGALEVILPGTHKRVRVEGFGVDPDMQLRYLTSPDGREHIFTLHATQGVIVERDREGRALTSYPVHDPGKPPASANPRDLAYANDGTLWITRYGYTSLLILDRSGAPAGTVDLKDFADDDGQPDMSAIAIAGDTAYVALRRLEKGVGTTKNDSTVVAIDTTTRAARPFVTLPAKAPVDKFKRRNNELWLACIGGAVLRPPDPSSGLVKIDLTTATARNVLPATAAGGFVTAFEIADDATGYAIVAAFENDNPTSLVRFDPSAGRLLDREPWAATAGYSFWELGLLPRSELLLVADRSRDNPGLRILSTRDGARLGHIPTRLPPVELFFLRSPDS